MFDKEASRRHSTDSVAGSKNGIHLAGWDAEQRFETFPAPKRDTGGSVEIVVRKQNKESMAMTERVILGGKVNGQ